MDKSLESFLHPARKANMKFRMTGFKYEFEFRQISAKEGIEIAKESDKRDLPGTLAMLPTMAAAMVVPDLRNKELQDAVSEKCGHKIIDPYNTMLELFTDSELAQLIQVYGKFINTNTEFSDGVEEAKN